MNHKFVLYSVHGPEAVFDSAHEAGTYLTWLEQNFAAYHPKGGANLQVAEVPHNPPMRKASDGETSVPAS